MARNRLWVSAYMIHEDGTEEKLLEKRNGVTDLFVPQEKLKDYEHRMTDNISKEVSRYVSFHPEEYIRKEVTI